MKPWYKEPWPWILMAPPGAAVAAGAATLWLAVSTADGLVAEDYYKQGLAINQVLVREQAAQRLGISADVEITSGKIKARLEGRAPQALFAHLAHATRSGLDLRLRLEPAGAGLYEAALPPLAAGRWRLILEDPRGEWRIVKEAP
jgi:hypothetical protein